MSDKRNDLPANSDINTKKSDTRYQQQEEYDNRGKEELARDAEVRNEQHDEQMSDSEMNGESMKQQTKGNAMGNRGRDQHPQ